MTWRVQHSIRGSKYSIRCEIAQKQQDAGVRRLGAVQSDTAADGVGACFIYKTNDISNNLQENVNEGSLV